MTELTQARLKKLLHYEPDTGVFTWLVNSGSRGRRGAVAGCKNTGGYIQIMIDKMNLSGHRLAWLHTYGSWPEAEIDHINGNREDNRICNLREASRQQNCQNMAVGKRNTSGFTGVYWNARDQKWMAEIMASGVKVRLGAYVVPEDAYAAYCAAKANLHTFNPTIRGAR